MTASVTATAALLSRLDPPARPPGSVRRRPPPSPAPTARRGARVGAAQHPLGQIGPAEAAQTVRRGAGPGRERPSRTVVGTVGVPGHRVVTAQARIQSPPSRWCGDEVHHLLPLGRAQIPGEVRRHERRSRDSVRSSRPPRGVTTPPCRRRRTRRAPPTASSSASTSEARTGPVERGRRPEPGTTREEHRSEPAHAGVAQVHGEQCPEVVGAREPVVERTSVGR